MYSEAQKNELFEKICDRIAQGEALKHITKEDSMPSRTEFYRWVDESEEKRGLYTRACEERAETIFDEILDIADDGSNDFMKIVKGDIEYEVENKEVTNRSKLRVEARKWVLSRMLPRKFGDKLQVEQTVKKLVLLDGTEGKETDEDNED